MEKKTKIILGLLLSLLIVGGGIMYFNSQNKETTPQYQLEKSKSSQKVVKKKNKSKKQTAIEEGKATLETQTPASEEQTALVRESLTKAMEVLGKTNIGEEVKNDYNSHLQNTNQDMMSVVVLMLKAGYKYDESSLEVYKSNSDNVSQFVFEMKKDGADPISFAGNYVQGTTQIEIANQHGTPVGLQSPDNSPQSN